MKVLVFGDNHLDIESFEEVKQKAKLVDFIICLGDLTWFEDGLNEMLEIVNTLPKQVLLIHGNHERLRAIREAVKPHANILFSHNQVVRIGDYDFITYGGDGFSRVDEAFEKSKNMYEREARDPKKTVLILHGPPFDTTLDIPFDDYHSGSMSTRAFIEDFQPLAVFAGHIHETFHARDTIGKTFLLNPGPDGEIIDLTELTSKYN